LDLFPASRRGIPSVPDTARRQQHERFFNYSGPSFPNPFPQVQPVDAPHNNKTIPCPSPIIPGPGRNAHSACSVPIVWKTIDPPGAPATGVMSDRPPRLVKTGNPHPPAATVPHREKHPFFAGSRGPIQVPSDSQGYFRPRSWGKHHPLSSQSVFKLQTYLQQWPMTTNNRRLWLGGSSTPKARGTGRHDRHCVAHKREANAQKSSSNGMFVGIIELDYFADPEHGNGNEAQTRSPSA